MKIALALSLMILAPTGHAASAAPADFSSTSDIEVVSVTPRRSAIKPFVLAIFTNEQRQRLAAASAKKYAPPVPGTNLLR